MKKLGLVTLAAVLVVLTLAAGCAQAAPESAPAGPAPTLVITPAIAPLAADTQIFILGSGFEPGQTIKIQGFIGQYANLSDITNVVDPPDPVPNALGCFSTSLTLGRFASRGITTPGTYYLMIKDANLNTLASAPVAFYEKPAE